LLVLLGLVLAAGRPVGAQEPDYLQTEGNMLVDSNGNRVILTGINWFGLETESFAPHGLWARPWESFLDQIKELGFNTIRLPYSNELLEPGSMPNGINYDLNPDLEGLNGLEVMDKIIAGAGERGLRVILDRHRPNSHAQSELWYTSEVSEERWIEDWVMLAERYQGDDTVIGVDLHNEPHGAATWGSGDPATDWRLAAERAGNAILEVNPNLLIIVQGVDRYEENWYWWGGNLMGAGDYPVRLDVPNRLVYSTHVYGPGVYPQPWFAEPEFPGNLPGIWDRHWGYLHHENVAPIIVGEFGGRSVGDDAEGIWQRALVSYLREHDLSYFYWTLNPNSGDTGGLLLDDWQTVDPEKQELLSGYQFPAIGAPQQTPEATEELPTAAPVHPESLQVQYRNAAPEPVSPGPKPEFIISNSGAGTIMLTHVELRYWLGAEEDAALDFRCDWAAINCHNIRGDFEVAENGSPYLRLRFTPGAGALDPGETSGEIKVRFNRSDWSSMQQEAHFSFGAHSEYRPWERVSLYVDGQQVWGREPGTTSSPETTAGVQASPTAAASPTPEATATLAPVATATQEPAEVAAVEPSPPPTSQPPGAGDSRSGSASGQFSTVELILAATAGAALVGLGVLLGLLLGRRRTQSTRRP
jgi:endoglucanase